MIVYTYADMFNNNLSEASVGSRLAERKKIIRTHQVTCIWWHDVLDEHTKKCRRPVNNILLLWMGLGSTAAIKNGRVSNKIFE